MQDDQVIMDQLKIGNSWEGYKTTLLKLVVNTNTIKKKKVSRRIYSQKLSHERLFLRFVCNNACCDEIRSLDAFNLELLLALA